MKKSFAIVLACILLIVSAVIGILIGAVLVIGGGLLGGFLEEMGAGLEGQLVILGLYGVGVFSIVWSALEVVASYGLWKLRKWGVYLAVILSLISIGISIGAGSILALIDIPFGLLIIILVVIGWKRSAHSKVEVED